MAATDYFDTTNQADIDLLPETMRKVTDIAKIAVRAERDVISAFTERAVVNTNALLGLSSDVFINDQLGLIIYLIGYKTAANDPDVDVDLKAALTDTIADVIEHRLRRRLTDPLTASQSDDSGKSTTYREDARHDFPPTWDWRMEPFDARPVTWAL